MFEYTHLLSEAIIRGKPSAGYVTTHRDGREPEWHATFEAALKALENTYRTPEQAAFLLRYDKPKRSLWEYLFGWLL